MFPRHILRETLTGGPPGQNVQLSYLEIEPLHKLGWIQPRKIVRHSLGCRKVVAKRADIVWFDVRASNDTKTRIAQARRNSPAPAK
jgi:hypothetical protein